MFARLLVRWPRTSNVVLSARSFRTTALVRAHDSAALLRPRLAPAAAQAIHVDEPAPTARSHFSALKFADAPISDSSKKSIRHEFMTDVQEATLELGLAGKDLLVQAKTGTGKTTAFLLPAIEQLAKKPIPPNGDVSILVLSPTRELAMQIEAEAATLIRNHPFRVQSVIGGVSLDTQKAKLRRQRCDILVATPGRLLDLLQSTRLREQMQSIQTVVLDEADRLLDIGFADTLNSILEYLPERAQNPWQCMLYSATISKDVKRIASRYLKRDHTFVSTLAEDEINTHEHVPQTCVTVPMSDTLKATLAVLQEDVNEHGNNSKAMVFCTTARGTAAIAHLLRGADRGSIPRVFSIQSRMTQNARLTVAENFKRAKNAILVTSDVTARGMDFPGVTLVVQLGLPSSAEQYIHRLGRTARAGKNGKGVIILTPHEANFLRLPEMSELPIHPHHELELPTLPPSTLDRELQYQAYTAWLGFNSGLLKYTRMRKEKFIEEANTYVRDVLGWTEEKPPMIPAKVASTLGLAGVEGVNTGGHTSTRWSDDGARDTRRWIRNGEERHRWEGRGRVSKYKVSRPERSERYDGSNFWEGGEDNWVDKPRHRDVDEMSSRRSFRREDQEEVKNDWSDQPRRPSRQSWGREDREDRGDRQPGFMSRRRSWGDGQRDQRSRRDRHSEEDF